MHNTLQAGVVQRSIQSSYMIINDLCLYPTLSHSLSSRSPLLIWLGHGSTMVNWFTAQIRQIPPWIVRCPIFPSAPKGRRPKRLSCRSKTPSPTFATQTLQAWLKTLQIDRTPSQNEKIWEAADATVKKVVRTVTQTISEIWWTKIAAKWEQRHSGAKLPNIRTYAKIRKASGYMTHHDTKEYHKLLK